MDREPLESTAALLKRYVEGDERAGERLFSRYTPMLRHWAHGRLPSVARDMMDTDDLVQDTLKSALGRIRQFEYRHEGAFLSYVRRILMNKVRDCARQAARRPTRVELDEHHAATAQTPLEMAIGREDAERYEAALARLPKRRREALVLRVEFQYSYAELAAALGGISVNAARLRAKRAVMQLAEILSVEP